MFVSPGCRKDGLVTRCRSSTDKVHYSGKILQPHIYFYHNFGFQRKYTDTYLLSFSGYYRDGNRQSLTWTTRNCTGAEDREARNIQRWSLSHQQSVHSLYKSGIIIPELRQCFNRHNNNFEVICNCHKACNSACESSCLMAFGCAGVTCWVYLCKYRCVCVIQMPSAINLI